MIGRLIKNYGFWFVVLLVIDRITKNLARTQCIQSCKVNQLLTFDFTLNRGISWGMLHSSNDTMFVVVSAIVVLITLGLAGYTFVRWMNNESIAGEILVLAGSISNIVDRALYNGVIDFISISFGTWSFPVFNVADMCIVLGVGIMTLELYKKS